MEDPPLAAAGDDPRPRRRRSWTTIIPDKPNKPYDMRDVIRAIVDAGDFFEAQPLYAQNIDHRASPA